MKTVTASPKNKGDESSEEKLTRLLETLLAHLDAEERSRRIKMGLEMLKAQKQ